MAYNSKGSDISNWYNGGSNVSSQPRPPVSAPRPSQIPGLGMMSDPASNEPRRNVIRDTDSDYIKLAKAGGQANLLQADPDLSNAQDMRSKRQYPSASHHQRAEWYYDNGAETNSSSQAPSPPKPLSYGGPAPVSGSPYGNQDQRYDDGDNEYYDRNDYVERAPYYADDRNGDVGSHADGRAMNGIGTGIGGPPLDSDAAYKRLPSNGASSVTSPQFANERADSRYSSVNRSDYGRGVTNNENNNNTVATPTASLNNEHHHHINRMVRENASKSDMSTLLSFGYLPNNGTGDTVVKQRQQPQQRAPNGPSDYMTEYQSKMTSDSRGGSAASTPLNRRDSEDSMWSAKDPGESKSNHSLRKPVIDDRPDFFRLGGSREDRSDFNMRKRVEDDRPDFFKIGGDRAQPDIGKPPQFGRRKASAEQRPDFFGSESAYEPTQASALARPAFGRMKYDQETKPDFFQIGGGGHQGSERRAADAGDGMDVLDKVSGYTTTQRNNFRRQKADPNAGIWAASPTRSGTK